MITENEITKGQEIPEAYKVDLADLLEKINKIRTAYGLPMTITSGFRSWHDHVRIYQEKSLKRGVPFYITQVPAKSNHLYCRAVDIADADGKLKIWVKDNIKLLQELGIFCEDFSATPTWVHFQICQPASGKRFFMP
jgi:uncharacterized protein YcbK (DUF882 family)